MHIKTVLFQGRKGWELSNDRLAVTILAGGGHIVGLTLAEGSAPNPYWVPQWKSIEPWQYRPQDAKKYEGKLLASIMGHNLCLSGFGNPSEPEQKAGLGCHYEAPVARWALLRKKVTAGSVVAEFACELPVARMQFVRRISMRRGATVARIHEQLANMARIDTPFTLCHHVTFGRPFLQPDVTVFDMPATRGHTFPGEFSPTQRLKPDTAYVWPQGPGRKGGKIDLRFMGQEPNSDFHANLMNPKKPQAWFSAVNPKQGLLVAYVWNRVDFPWLGVWEENQAHKVQPWNGKELTRGMEFANSPFPIGTHKAVDLGRFHGLPTFRWLPALEAVSFDYDILAAEVDHTCKGVSDISREADGYALTIK